ncbi:MAG: hypothetical protein V7635_643 [Arthrobacter sp.]
MPATGSGSPCLDFEPAVLAGSPHSDTVLAATPGGYGGTSWTRKGRIDGEVQAIAAAKGVLEGGFSRGCPAGPAGDPRGGGC